MNVPQHLVRQVVGCHVFLYRVENVDGILVLTKQNDSHIFAFSCCLLLFVVLIGIHQSVLRHSLHVRLYDGFHLTLHLLAHLGFLVCHVVLQQQVGAETIHSLGLLSVPLQQVVALDILIETIDVVDSPCVLGWRGEQVDAEAHILLVVAQIAQYRRHNVYLLGDGIAHARLKFATRVEEDDRRAETT